MIDGFRCGSIEVPKYRSAPETGQLRDRLRGPAAQRPHAPSKGAIFAVEGGPGYSSTGTANAYTKLFGDLLDDHELVLVDMRGTGLSEPIDCPDLQRGTAPEWIALGECARRLGDDFEAYNTGAAADDIDAVREKLGYDEISLYGDSYGTFLSQSYAYRHPDTLTALVLDGAYPVQGENPWYPSLIKSGNRNFVTACNRSPDCPPGAADRLDEQVDYMREHGMNAGVLVDAIAAAAYGPPNSYLRVERAGARPDRRRLEALDPADQRPEDELRRRPPVRPRRRAGRRLQRLPDDLGEGRLRGRAPGSARGGDPRLRPGRVRAVHAARGRDRIRERLQRVPDLAAADRPARAARSRRAPSRPRRRSSSSTASSTT